MKKLTALLIAVITVLSLSACGKKEPPPEAPEPAISQMQAICELAVTECYYHNVAKFREEDAQGILWWQKDKHFWIEYSGIVKLGIDASLLTMDVKGDTVTITLPEAKVLRCTIDDKSLSRDSYIVDKHSADISAEDEVKALSVAQKQLEENAASDKALLISAQERVQTLLRDYVDNLGRAAGRNYTVRWEYLDSEGNAYSEKPAA